MAVKYLAGDRLTGTAAERAAMTATKPYWQLLGREKRESNGASVEVTGCDKKEHVMILGSIIPSASTFLTFSAGNGSYPTSGGGYSDRRRENFGTSYTTGGRDNNSIITDISDDTPMFTVGQIANFDGSDKKVIWNTIYGHDDDTYPESSQTVSKCDPNSGQLDQFKIDKNGSGTTFDTDTEMIVLGYDEGDTSGDNMWELLATETVGGSSVASVTTDAFTGKKYLWIQILNTATVAHNDLIQFGNPDIVASGRYDGKFQMDWSYDNAGNEDFFIMGNNAWTGPSYTEMFMCNIVNKTKLALANMVQAGTAGVANVPHSTEFYGRFQDNVTSPLITTVKLSSRDASGAVDIGAGSQIRVWGFD